MKGHTTYSPCDGTINPSVKQLTIYHTCQSPTPIHTYKYPLSTPCEWLRPKSFNYEDNSNFTLLRTPLTPLDRGGLDGGPLRSPSQPPLSRAQP